MKKLIALSGILFLSSGLWSQTINQPNQSNGYTVGRQGEADYSGNGSSGKKCCCSSAGDWLKQNNGNFNVGFTYWAYAQTDKNALSTLNPWQTYNILSLDAGYENDNLYGYILYTFNDNSVGQWLGYKFSFRNKGGDEKTEKKWDIYAVFTEYPSGALPYAGVGLEHSWDIQGPLSISYFVEAGARNYLTTWSTGFMVNFQQGMLRKAKK